jgi:polyphosphate kinase
MILKMNSLIDPGMMKKLYRAAKAGVKIELIVRGIFGLTARPEKFRENITAISIVDKYLEHSRIFLFGNGGDEKMYISSADWMPRNLNRRTEVACPVYDEGIREELKEMLKIQLHDNTKARILDTELKNNYNKDNLEEATFRAQEDYYKYIKNKHHIVMKIYHNPRCSKSRAGLKYLEEKGYDLEIVKYLNDGLSENELKEVIAKTGKKPVEFVRTRKKSTRKITKARNFLTTNGLKLWLKIQNCCSAPLL